MPQTQAAKTPILAYDEVEVATNQATRVNANSRLSEAIAPLLVKDKDLATPPGSPAEGDRYIIAASPTGAWAGKAKNITYYSNAAWKFITQIKGYIAYVDDEDKYYKYDGAAWVEYTVGATTAPTWTVITKTANFTVSLSEAAIYLIDASSGNVTATMLAAASMSNRAFIFKRIDSSANTVTIDGNASETIDGNLTLELASQYDSATIVSNGTNLYII